jgi:hypothetical protein
VLVALAGCTATPGLREPVLPVGDGESQPYVTLERDGASTWRATWHLPAPVRELRFARWAAGFRSGVFEVLTPGYSVAKDRDHEVLRTDGEPQRTIAVRFPEYTRILPKEYEFFQKFSDGSVSIYTGHLLVSLGDDRLVRDFRFVPRDAVVAGGKRSTSTIEWIDQDASGTYVYFGSITPVETSHTVSVVDPGLPDWLERTARDAIPRLFDLYTRRLGAKLPKRPTVLFSYAPSDQPGFDSGGGTCPDLIQLTVEGREWERESPEAMLRLFHFVAHEAAHLWNGQIVHYPGSEDAWMHEGSADALAERALVDLGLADEARLLEYQTEALNACRRGAGAGPLRGAAKRGEFDLYYTCGNVIALWTESVVRQQSHDLFGFWRSLIERAAKRGTYGSDDYTAVWRQLGATPDDLTTLERIRTGTVDPDAFVTPLRQHGVEITETEDVPQPFGQALSRAALWHILTASCRGGYGFRWERQGFLLDSGLHCDGFSGGELVTAIGGHDVRREGHRSWDALHESCGDGGSVSVALRGADGEKTVDIPCRDAVRPRPPYVRVVSRQPR